MSKPRIRVLSRDALLERRRIRRAIGPAMKFLASYNANDFEKRIQAVGVIDRATKAPRRKS